MNILGISCFYHDASACLLVNGKVVSAAAEERFSRIKHDSNFPLKAIEFCLSEANIAMNELDAVAFYEKPLIKFERILTQHIQYFPKSYQTYSKTINGWFNQKLNIKEILKKEYHFYGKIFFVSHHLSHAASAFYTSGFKDSIIVTLDGVGEWSTTTIGFGSNNSITLEKEIRFPHSLGLLYSALTAFLGFEVNNDEYKVMGLSAYGDPKWFAPHFEHLIKQHNDGSYKLNMRYFEYGWNLKMFSKKMEQLFSIKSRRQSEPVKMVHAHIAAALQNTLEQTTFKILSIAHKKYNSNRLCLAGGVALNSLLNGKIISNTPFTELHIPPDPGDGGGSVGAAFEIYFHHSKNARDNNIYEVG